MKRLLLVVAMLGAFAVSRAADDSWAKARIEKSPRHLEWITVKHDNREVGAYVGYPEVKDKAPAVIIIHEIFGLSDWARSVVDEFAEAGYIAIAPDLLWGLGAKGGGTSELNAAEIGQKIRTLPADQITADLNAAADYVAKLPACNGKIVVIGFCWGGGESFRYATNNPSLKAAFVCYGGAPKADALAKIKAPVYGFYGGNDARISATVPATTDAMKAAGKTYEPVIYDGAGHGFMRSGEAPDASEANKKAHDQAWAKIKEVLGKI
ncbi:MAG TPA: dienelactone hydrolase family protein [Opitutaceae bacterium]|nr:dienelactone hydrolase family protein [Opitutaceae bacterium]